MKGACMQQSAIKHFTPVSSSQTSAHPRSFLPCSLPQRHTQHARRTVQARAQQQQEQKPEVAKFADSVGLPTEEGLFGFKPFPEVRQHIYRSSACPSLKRCRHELTDHCTRSDMFQHQFSPICMEQARRRMAVLCMSAYSLSCWPDPH